MRFFTVLVCSGCLLVPAALVAEDVATGTALPTTVQNIASVAGSGSGSDSVKSEATSAALAKANSLIDRGEAHLLANSDFTHLDISIGSDSFGLDSGSRTKTEIMSTYRLHETDGDFIFAQGSAVDFDGRTTVNFGLGYRHINDGDTVITGVNAFYDYELDAKHRRTGVGVELLTSALEMRYNRYRAQTGTRLYKGYNETALNGSDYKVAANLPYFYAADLFYRRAKWKEGGYRTSHKEWGVSAEILPYLTIGMARQRADSGKRKSVASVSYAIPLGGPTRDRPEMQDGTWSTKLMPIRDQLYRPVERENRIMKKTIKLGVVVSGY